MPTQTGAAQTGFAEELAEIPIKPRARSAGGTSSGKSTDESFDPVTGLASRYRLTALAETAGNKQICVFAIAIDQYTRLVGMFGRADGDRLLTAVAKRLGDSRPSWMEAGRIEGPLFALVATDGMPPDGAEALARRLTAELSHALQLTGASLEPHEVFVTVSIGVAWRREGESYETVLDRAVATAAQAGLRGGNRWSLDHGEDSKREMERLTLSASLRAALEDNRIVVHYQPRFALGDGKMVGAEAQLRWNDPVYGEVQPAVFFPLAQEIGLADELGVFALRHAVAQLAAWRDERWSEAMTIAVNFSPHQLRDAAMVEEIRKTLARHLIAPERLVVEITEDRATEEASHFGDANHFGDALAKLAESGVTLAAMDFGLGPSTLELLRHQLLGELRIASPLVRGMTDTPTDRHIVGALAAMGRKLGLSVAATGVDSSEQLECLAECDVDIVQGAYFGRPLSAADFYQQAPGWM